MCEIKRSDVNHNLLKTQKITNNEIRSSEYFFECTKTIVDLDEQNTHSLSSWTDNLETNKNKLITITADKHALEMDLLQCKKTKHYYFQ